MSLHNEANRVRPIQPEVARDILGRVDVFFSESSYATRGTLLSLHDGAGLIPTARSIAIAVQTFGSHSHGIGEGDMELPRGVTWNNLNQAGLIDMRNGLLRIDLLRQAAGEPPAE